MHVGDCFFPEVVAEQGATTTLRGLFFLVMSARASLMSYVFATVAQSHVWSRLESGRGMAGRWHGYAGASGVYRAPEPGSSSRW